MKNRVKYIFLVFSFLGAYNSWGQLSPGDLSEAHKHLEGVGNCTECHILGSQVSDDKCLDCHKEIQTLIDADRGYHVSVEVEGKSCVICHSEHHGRGFDLFRLDEDKFDHDLADYKLEGEHWIIDCRECHKPENIASEEIRKLSDTYLGLEEDCLSCHTDFHQETLGEDCKECHNFTKWDPAKFFDHKDAEYQLLGAHKEVDCIECHKKTIRNEEEFQQFTDIEFKLCTDCHDNPHNSSFSTNCTECHNEISWSNLNSSAGFNHDMTDYPLTGEHIGVDCKECHTSGNNTNSLEYELCKNCHDDYHNEQFTSIKPELDCNECHTLDQPFTRTIYGLAEHQESDFKLEGAHIATPCFVCHVDESSDRWEFRDIGEDCVDCHDDIHEGLINESYYPESNCAICHSSDIWSDIDFDHSTTDWDLEGGHIEVSCRECHFSEIGESQEFDGRSTNCSSCHEDEHSGQFDLVGDCNECHTTEKGWEAKLFNHNETDFPLEGKHKDVNCLECHTARFYDQNDESVNYKIERFECIDCHQ